MRATIQDGGTYSWLLDHLSTWTLILPRKLPRAVVPGKNHGGVDPQGKVGSLGTHDHKPAKGMIAFVCAGAAGVRRDAESTLVTLSGLSVEFHLTRLSIPTVPTEWLSGLQVSSSGGVNLKPEQPQVANHSK